MSSNIALFIGIVAVVVVILLIAGIFLSLLLDLFWAVGEIFSLLGWIGKFCFGVIKVLLSPFRRQ